MMKSPPVLVLSLLTFAATSVLGQPTPVGGEFQINTYTSGNQQEPDVGVAADGSFVVVWESAQDDVDTSGNSVQAQRYAANGSPLASEFLVNTTTVGAGNDPRVAVGLDGDFVVVWSALFGVGGYIDAQRFDSSGSPTGGEFQVNTATNVYLYRPDVAVRSDGTFVVVWEAGGTGSVRGRRFSSAGSPLGGEFEVASSSAGERPRLGFNGSGDFLVSWQDQSCGVCTDTDSFGVVARLFDSSGADVSGEFQVNLYTPSLQYTPSVASNPDGDFLVAWSSVGWDEPGGDNGDAVILGRWISSAGSLVGNEFQINSYTTGFQSLPSVETDPVGNVVVAFSSGFNSPGNDTDSLSVLMRSFDAEGNAVGNDFQVNTFTTQGQNEVEVAIGPGSEVIAVWQSSGSGAGVDPPPSKSVQGQRYLVDSDGDGIGDGVDLCPGLDDTVDSDGNSLPDCMIFVDGFESGNVTPWSTAQP